MTLRPPPHDLLLKSLGIECRRERTSTLQQYAAHHYSQDEHKRQVYSDGHRLHAALIACTVSSTAVDMLYSLL
jgi:hypothetical protein